MAHLNQHTGQWWVAGQGCGIRYDALECGSGSTNSEVIAAEALNKDFTITRDLDGDLGGCIIKNNDVKEFSCIDLLQTNGFTGNLVYLKTKEGETESLRFKNGLAKEIITTTPPATTVGPGGSTTTTSNPNTTTTTLGPGYCVVETEPECYNCTQFCESPNYVSGPFASLEVCQSQLPGLNTNCAVDLEFDDPCYACYYQADGSYTGPTKMADCLANADDFNESVGYPCVTTTTTTACPDYYLNKYDDPNNCHYCSQNPNNSIGTYTGCSALNDCEEARIEADIADPSCTTTTTSTEPPCPTMYLHKNENDDCHYCSQEPGDLGAYAEFLENGSCTTYCDNAAQEMDLANPDCGFCYNLVGSCASETCWTCVECPQGDSGDYSTAEACNTVAAEKNAQCSPPCVTTTVGPTTTTEDPNSCVEVVTAVYCDEDGEFTYDKVSVKKCSIVIPPAVFEGMPNLEMLLLKAKVESLTDQLSRLYNILQLYGIDAMGDK